MQATARMASVVSATSYARRRLIRGVRQENPDAHLHYVLCGRCEYDACDIELRIDLDLYRARNPACRGIDDYEGLLLGEGQGP